MLNGHALRPRGRRALPDLGRHGRDQLRPRRVPDDRRCTSRYWLGFLVEGGSPGLLVRRRPLHLHPGGADLHADHHAHDRQAPALGPAGDLRAGHAPEEPLPQPVHPQLPHPVRHLAGGQDVSCSGALIVPVPQLVTAIVRAGRGGPDLLHGPQHPLRLGRPGHRHGQGGGRAHGHQHGAHLPPGLRHRRGHASASPGASCPPTWPCTRRSAPCSA
ncbi:MAG: hypothetical protein MZV64_09595 [Ignavibacteriales bacterium]|nr:hypothetical protein [Ignavibacteriales bacterium]